MKPGRRVLLRALAALALPGVASGQDKPGESPGAATPPGRQDPPPSSAGGDAVPAAAPAPGNPPGDPVLPRALVFPRDHGAHPGFRSEWWYLTGWLDPATAGGNPLGFQLTFFRVRTGVGEDNPSAFAPRQVLLAHAALADPARGALLHDQAIARAGFGVVDASDSDTDLRLDRWSLKRDAESGRYRSVIRAREFALELEAEPTGPLLLQGDAGLSRKGPAALQASYYYSRPQLAVTATITQGGQSNRRETRRGRAWLDHEWSSAYLAPDAVGWDWLGMNLDDGGALTAFVIRPKVPDAPPVWAYAALRDAGGRVTRFGRDAVHFAPLRHWVSPRSRGRWPVAMAVTVGGRRFVTEPLMDDQELDSRASTGAVYWEGASRLLEGDRPVGRGYLELTGYVAPLRL